MGLFGLSRKERKEMNDLLAKQNTSDSGTGRRENGLSAKDGRRLQILLRKAKGINHNG